MNRLTNLNYTASVAIAIAIAIFPTNSDAAAKKTTSPASVKLKSAKQTPSPDDHQLMAKKAAAKLTPTQKSKMLTLLNEGNVRDLVAIHGIGKSRAAALTKARPFKSVDQLANVKGVGEVVYTDLLSHAKSLTARRSTKKPAKNSTAGKAATTSTAKSKSSKSKGN